MATIDLVAEDADGRVLLVLIHDPTTEPLETLKERVQLSASYAVDGELAEAFPVVEGRPVAIRIDVPAEPSGALRPSLTTSALASPRMVLD